MVVLLWLQFRISRDKEPARLTAFELGEIYGYLHKLDMEIEKTKPGFLQKWLLKKIREDQVAALKLSELGFTEAGIILKKK